MKKGLSVFLILLVPLLQTGCSTYGYKTPIGEHTYPPVDYHKVQLIFGGTNRPYEVIGIVSVQGGAFASYGDMCQKLIKSAAVLGADGVIVTGEGNNQAIVPGMTSSVGTLNAYGGGLVGTSTTVASPTYIANMPTNKGLAIKFTK